jgi:tetratricopeptide (TPR) repeat protein
MKKIIVLLITLGIYTHLLAQESLQKAFERSIEQEKTTNYNGAVQTMLTVYNAKNYECNLRIGYLKYLAGSYQESMNYYQKAIALMPYAIEPLLGYAYPAAALGKWDDVVAKYQAILKIDPHNSSVNYRLGVIYYNRKKYAQAYTLFEKVVNLYPFDYDGLLMYAWSNYRLGKLQQAKVLFNKVLLISPNDKSALEGLGLIK